MRLETSIDAWAAAFFASLGFGVTGCGSTGEGGPGEVPFQCSQSEPIMAAGTESGFERCSEGFVHRVAATTCSSELPRATQCEDNGGGSADCREDSDCTDGANGYCNSEPWGGCSCRYGCLQDSDCGDNQICMCGSPVGQCVRADCTSDADCGGDMMCTSYISEPGCGSTAFACQTAGDECAADADCAQGEQCTHDGKRHVCEQVACAIGRPFLVRGEERLASPASRCDWNAELTPSVEGLPRATRDVLREQWTRIGLMEHASVAAFARFALQLLSMGAPPELVEQTNAAMSDETAHATMAFALASAYGGEPVGPGPLSIDGSFDENGDRHVLATVLREGCVGETVAALEATEAAAHAVDPVVRAALEKIADDERRHAELAWRFVRWALEGADAELRGLVADEIADVLAEQPHGGADDCPITDDELLAHGVVPETMRAEIRRRALAEIVGPCARALLERGSGVRPAVGVVAHSA